VHMFLGGFVFFLVSWTYLWCSWSHTTWPHVHNIQQYLMASFPQSTGIGCDDRLCISFCQAPYIFFCALFLSWPDSRTGLFLCSLEHAVCLRKLSALHLRMLVSTV
jgi:hypothetical protein